MKGQLTLKQRKFWKHYQEHHNKAQAAKYAGCACTSVSNLSHQGDAILNSLQLTMQEMLNANGLTNEFLSKGLIDGCQCDKVEIATFQGKIKDVKHFPDYSTRSKYYDMLSRMKGVYVDKLELAGKDGGEISLVVSKAGKKGSKTLDLD